SNCFSNEIGFVFLAKDLEERQSSPEGTEVLQVKKLPLQKCLEMIYDGGITDAMSIIGIHRAEKFLNSTHS
ncbi:MAG: DNA mismatch repair protein MutT, partial [Proteobacteria bacterium]|nr:DNA mismatch repair protein MutT [Pseudomonadota bacterium]